MPALRKIAMALCMKTSKKVNQQSNHLWLNQMNFMKVIYSSCETYNSVSELYDFNLWWNFTQSQHEVDFQSLETMGSNPGPSIPKTHPLTPCCQLETLQWTPITKQGWLWCGFVQIFADVSLSHNISFTHFATLPSVSSLKTLASYSHVLFFFLIILVSKLLIYFSDSRFKPRRWSNVGVWRGVLKPHPVTVLSL